MRISTLLARRDGRRCLWLSATALLAGAVLCAGLVIPVRGTTPDSAALAASRDAVARGLDYLASPAASVRPLQWLVLDFLRRRFNLDDRFAAADREFQFDSVDERDEFFNHRRIIWPDRAELGRLSNDPLRRMMALAAHCDQVPLPSDFAQLLQRNVDAGGYELTHAGFSLERLRENDCVVSGLNVDRMRTVIIEELRVLAGTRAAIPDLRYEAIAFLFHMGRKELVQNDWLDAIVREQQSDGGWKAFPGPRPSDDHATVLAVWALLERTRVGRAEVLLRR